jgi:SAM-dependent methyltransferase
MPSKDPSPFADAAEYYDRYRPPYATAAIDFIARAFDLGEGARVLDLGCGPGTLAIPLSLTGAEVVAVDPEPAMIAQGQRQAEARGAGPIRWLRSRAEDLPADTGPFRLVTLGQSFHWMDRDAVLQKLALLTEAGGGLALVNPGKRRPQESWEDTVRAVVGRFLGPNERGPGANPKEPEHEPALRRSPAFRDFTSQEFAGALTRDVSGVIGYVYSTSGAARPRFGGRAAEFEAELSQALLELNPSGIFEERIETEVIIARKR